MQWQERLAQQHEQAQFTEEEGRRLVEVRQRYERVSETITREERNRLSFVKYLVACERIKG